MHQSDIVNPVDHPVSTSVQHRWSPYRYDSRPVEKEKLIQCLEAARWAASSFNDQPWFWIVATKEEDTEFQQMLGCLMEANQAWAANAGALILTGIRNTFAYNNKPNRVALHDLGQAACQLSLEATRLGLQAHQMAGINLSLIRQTYQFPEGHEPQTAIALGYPATDEPNDDPSRQLHKREQGARVRKPLQEQVFVGKYGRPAEFLG